MPPHSLRTKSAKFVGKQRKKMMLAKKQAMAWKGSGSPAPPGKGTARKHVMTWKGCSPAPPVEHVPVVPVPATVPELEMAGLAVPPMPPLPVPGPLCTPDAWNHVWDTYMVAAIYAGYDVDSLGLEGGPDAV